MNNLTRGNSRNLQLILNKSDYWDFCLNKDSNLCYFGNTNEDKKKECLASYIDAADKECIGDKFIKGKIDFAYKDTLIEQGYTLKNYGYTGIDNGSVWCRKDMLTNEEILKIFTETELKLDSEDFSTLHLFQIQSNTMKYSYDVEYLEDSIKLNGGFFQGFFKTEKGKYQVLPHCLENEWNIEIELSRFEHERTNPIKIMNDDYANNKGMFFFIGTRAENKFAFLYNKDLQDGEYVEDNSINNGYAIDDGEQVECLDYFTYDVDSENNLDPSICPFEEHYCTDDFFHSEVCGDELKDPCEEEKKENDCCRINYIYFIYNKMDRYNILRNTEKEDWECDISWDGDNKESDDVYYYGDEICLDNSNNIKGEWLSEDAFGKDNDIYISEPDFYKKELDIKDFVYETDSGLRLDLNQKMIVTDNKFLLFDRTNEGFTTKNWEEGTELVYISNNYKNDKNLFLYMNRGENGFTTQNYVRDFKEYDVMRDLYRNAIGFRITDDGEIGYRYLVRDCDKENDYKIEEFYSKKDVIKYNEWCKVRIRFKSFRNSMRIFIYVNDKLKLCSKYLPKINLRKLSEEYEKQEGVPFNISIGGGTQGLAEMILPNHMDSKEKVLPLEKEFGGTFIGYFRNFRFYGC